MIQLHSKFRGRYFSIFLKRNFVIYYFDTKIFFHNDEGTPAYAIRIYLQLCVSISKNAKFTSKFSSDVQNCTV